MEEIRMKWEVRRNKGVIEGEGKKGKKAEGIQKGVGAVRKEEERRRKRNGGGGRWKG